MLIPPSFRTPHAAALLWALGRVVAVFGLIPALRHMEILRDETKVRIDCGTCSALETLLVRGRWRPESVPSQSASSVTLPPFDG